MTPRQLRAVAAFCALAAFCLLLRSLAVNNQPWASRQGAPVRSGGSVVQPLPEVVDNVLPDVDSSLASGGEVNEKVESPGALGLPDAQESTEEVESPGPSPLPDANTPSAASEGPDWSRFAYVQYVTNPDYLCNSLLIFESLARLGSKPARLMLYPTFMLPSPDAPSADDVDGQLLIKARDEYNVTLKPIMIQHRDGEDETWADSFTKLLAFNQTQYERVLTLDSDGTILRAPDELFLMPHGPLALPRAYWLLSDDPPQHILASHVMLIEPSTHEFDRIHEQIHMAGEREYDMEIINKLYENSAMVLPHRDYAMLTAEFRKERHGDYLGGDDEAWDPVASLDTARYVHFSDWPVPKPWVPVDEAVHALREEYQPACVRVNEEGQEDCRAREIWNKLYDDFMVRKETICGKVEMVRDELPPNEWIDGMPPPG